MTWQPDESWNISWTTKSVYEREKDKLLEEDRGRMFATLQQLKDKKLLDEKMIDGTFPQISIRYECHISPCPLSGIVPRKAEVQ